MKKKVLALCLVVVLAATAVIGGTLAYFTDTDEATNTFTVGNLDITLIEPNWKEENAQNIVPGTSVPKDPQVIVEEGSVPSHVRVVVTMPKIVYDYSDFYHTTESGKNCLISFADQSNAWAFVEARDNGNYTKEIVLEYNLDGDNVTGPNALPALFTAVKFSENITNDETDPLWDSLDGDFDFDITVKAYAVQAAEGKTSTALFVAAFPEVFHN